MAFYTDAQRASQERFDTRRLADRMNDTIVQPELDEATIDFIEQRDFFFLSTVNGRGEPSVSYKGGPVGLVSALDPKTLVFPIYDGNGMFLSVGNIDETSNIGMLFIDFETPNRIRVQAEATTSVDDAEIARYPGAIALVRANVTAAFVNCARLIHKHTRTETSKYVPDDDGATPYPTWKRIDFVQDALPDRDQGRAEREGGVIRVDEYTARLADGDS